MSERNFGNLEAREWDGDQWPEKRVSIADADTGYAVMISPRYEGIDQAMANAEEICLIVNSHGYLYDALEELVGLIGDALDGNYEFDIFTAQSAKAALAKARGEM